MKDYCLTVGAAHGPDANGRRSLFAAPCLVSTDLSRFFQSTEMVDERCMGCTVWKAMYSFPRRRFWDKNKIYQDQNI
jgi:hypothetical protein